MAYLGPNPATTPLTEDQIQAAGDSRYITGKATQNFTDAEDLLAALNLNIGSLLGHGQCRFVYTSSTVLTLVPYNGNRLVIDGISRVIPSSGVTISPWGAGIHRYVYAYWTGSAIALESSSTGHSRHTDGVEIKTGDPTRTLVGMAATIAGNLFSDTVTYRAVASWFNRSRKHLRNSAFVNTSSLTATNISSNYLYFLAWNDSLVDTSFSIAIDLPDANTGSLGITTDGTLTTFVSAYAGAATGNWFDTLSGTFSSTGYSENVTHYHGVSGAVTGGSMLIINSPYHIANVDI